MPQEKETIPWASGFHPRKREQRLILTSGNQPVPSAISRERNQRPLDHLNRRRKTAKLSIFSQWKIWRNFLFNSANVIHKHSTATATWWWHTEPFPLTLWKEQMSASLRCFSTLKWRSLSVRRLGKQGKYRHPGEGEAGKPQSADGPGLPLENAKKSVLRTSNWQKCSVIQ